MTARVDIGERKGSEAGLLMSGAGNGDEGGAEHVNNDEDGSIRDSEGTPRERSVTPSSTGMAYQIAHKRI